MLGLSIIPLLPFLSAALAAITTDVGLPDFPYEDQSAWRQAIVSGRRALDAHARSCQRPVRQNRPLRTGEYRFQVSPAPVPFRHPFEAVVGPADLRAVSALDGVEPGNYAGQAAGVNAAYANLVDPRRGVIVCHDNDRGADHSQRLHLSAILFESYARVAQEQARDNAGGGRLRPAQANFKWRSRFWPDLLPPLRYVVRAAITGPATVRVLEIAHRKRGAPPTAPQAFEPRHLLGRSEEFDALAGTIHVKSLLHMLADYCGWARQRRLVRIHSVYAPTGFPSVGWFMLLEFGE